MFKGYNFGFAKLKLRYILLGMIVTGAIAILIHFFEVII
jgi:hypothetical protein